MPGTGTSGVIHMDTVKTMPNAGEDTICPRTGTSGAIQLDTVRAMPRVRRTLSRAGRTLFALEPTVAIQLDTVKTMPRAGRTLFALRTGTFQGYPT